MPEGDTIFRAARTLNRALAGRTVTRFQSVFPALQRIDHDSPLRGRLIGRVEARGKHLLIWFDGDLVLRTHMRMHGSWHIYRPGERWRRPGHDMRIVIETAEMQAVAFNVPVAEFATARELERAPPLVNLGPDPLSGGFDAAEAARRIIGRGDMEIAEALLDQTAIAGIGNIYKSEILHVARVNPFAPVNGIPLERLERLLATAVKVMRANVGEPAGGGIGAPAGLRRTTGSPDPAARFWVYGRAGKPCRRCGTLIRRRRQGPNARSTYWCERCQPALTQDRPPSRRGRP